MTIQKWAEVKELLSACLDLPEEERPAYLTRACAGRPELRRELEELVAASEKTRDFLESPAMAAPEIGTDPLVGASLGRYRIVEQLGRGGMGTVYLAVRDDGEFEQQVALKLVRHGLETDLLLTRFRFERQVLAFLNHPNIARMLDGGATPDGRPYYVMEYISGQPVTEYCRAKALPLNARLNLFQHICSAVEYAHRNLIVHRDLKPTNILVTPDGTPKLVDFGIARFNFPGFEGVPEASTQGLFLTPDYASPEQVRREPATTASDIYSLGAVLYELLTEEKPHKFKSMWPTEVERVVCEEDPVRPSAASKYPNHPSLHRRNLEGDLDRIVLKAMQKEPGRRYASVDQFSEDIRRHLQGLPVSAREDTLIYRGEKFVARHRTAVASAVVIFVTLIAGIAATVRQAQLARLERDRAERRFQDVRKLANTLVQELDALAVIPGAMAVRDRLVRQSLEYLDSLNQEGQGDQDLQSELADAYEKMGDVQGRQDGANLGDAAGAVASYRKAVALRERLVGESGSRQSQRSLAGAYARLSGILRVTGDYQAGLAFDRKALRIREELVRAEPGNREFRRGLADSYSMLGGSLSQLGDWDGVLQARRSALALCQELVTEPDASLEDWRGLALAHNRMASILNRNNDMEGAIRHYQQAMEAAWRGTERAPDHLGLRTQAAAAGAGLANVHLGLNRIPEALRFARDANRAYASIAEAEPRDFRARSMLARSHTRIGKILLRSGERRGALAEFQEALRMREGLAAGNPMNAGARGEVAESYGHMGDAYAASGQFHIAMDWHKKARETLQAMEESGQLNTASRQELARVQREIERISALASSRNRG